MQQAYKYGIRGSVQRKNTETFFIIAEGECSALEKFIHWCETFQLNYPDCVSMEEKEIRHYKTFDIIRDRDEETERKAE